MGKKILGIVLLVVGLILLMTFNLALVILGCIMFVIGGVLLLWVLYQWRRKRAVDTIAEGVRKAQEKGKDGKQ